MPSRRRWSPPNEIGKLANPSSSANSTNSPNSDDNSTVPIADLVREAPTTMPFSNGRCIYFTPPSANSTAIPNGQSPNKGLRRFLFFGDSPQPPFLLQPTNRRPFAPNSTSNSLPLDEAPLSFASPLAPNRFSAATRGCAFLGTKQRHQNSSNFPLLLGSHSSRTVSLDFDSESTGTTVPAEEILPRKNPPEYQPQRNKCDANKKLHQQNAAFRHSQQQMPMDSPPSADGGHPQRRRAAGPPLNFGGGSQFDAQSLQARRSRSFAATHSHHQQMSSYPNGSIGGTPAQQHNSMPMRCGSCSNLSLAAGGLNGGGGQLVLYEGGGQMGHQQQEAMATQRHSMILPMDVGQLSAPIWYQPIPGPPPPPPPFYYTAATLPHPGTTPLDYKAFKYALKESERLEKKQRKIMMAEFGDETFGGACCEFCCGGSALIFWLVISLVALGFIGFLLMAIYFV